MYQHYFSLAEAPFSIAPDPRYLFLSDKHREALAHLIYGVGNQGGFILLTGEVGTGKTTICRCLLQQIPDNADVAFIINPKQSINQLLQSICNDLHISFDKGQTSKDLIDNLNEYLMSAHAKGRNTILIIDEAQNLSIDVLEQLRLLTNLETNEKKLLQLVLLGQPELNTILGRAELRQLAQRVTARFHLTPLSKNEVSQYIEHRLSIAGSRSELFNAAAVRSIVKHSRGIPRLINQICDRALLGVYASNEEQATSTIVNKAAKEIFMHKNFSDWNKWRPLIAATIVSLLILLTLYMISSNNTSELVSASTNEIPLADKRSVPVELLPSKSSEIIIQPTSISASSPVREVSLPIKLGDNNAVVFELKALLVDYDPSMFERLTANPSRDLVQYSQADGLGKYGILLSHQRVFPAALLSTEYDVNLEAVLEPLRKDFGISESGEVSRIFIDTLENTIRSRLSESKPELAKDGS